MKPQTRSLRTPGGPPPPGTSGAYIDAEALVRAFGEDLELSPGQRSGYLRIATIIDEHLASRQRGGDWRGIEMSELLGCCELWSEADSGAATMASQRLIVVSEMVELLRWMVLQGLLPGACAKSYLGSIEDWLSRFWIPERLWRGLEHLMDQSRRDCERASYID